MIYHFILFIIGVLTGFAFLGIIATGKQNDLWEAIKLAAYKNDISLCKKLTDLE